MSASGFAGGKFDVGAYERDEIILIEVDAQGRRRRLEVFAADRLGDAVARLYERYAELLPDGPARDRAAATARSVAAVRGTARPRSLRHGVRARHRGRRPPDPGDLVRARSGSAPAARPRPARGRRRRRLRASTTSSACGPTRSSCAGRTPAPTAPAAAPSSGSHLGSGLRSRWPPDAPRVVRRRPRRPRRSPASTS